MQTVPNPIVSFLIVLEIYLLTLTMFVYLFKTLILLFKTLLNFATKLMATHHPILPDMLSKLPDEILNDIFSRIPLKSIGKLRCLSKTWHTFLSTPHFINSHHSHKTHQQSLILLTKSSSLHVIKLPIENPTISNELELGNSWKKLIGSCNGLVLLFNSYKQMCLVNPSTLEQFKVLKLTFPDSKKVLETVLRGFGYDRFTDDYKIIVISRLFSIVNECTDDKCCCSFDTSVEVYSVRSGVWRSIINHSLYRFSACGGSCGAFTNGSIHWFVNRQKSGTSFGILAFNLATELFSELDIALDFFGPEADCRVFSHEGCLCIMNPLWTEDFRSSGKTDVWMMKEYGNVKSWTKLGTLYSDGKWYTCVPLYCSRDEEILLDTCVRTVVGNNLEELTLTCEHTMIVYNLQQGMVTDMVVNGGPASFSEGLSFVDSLVSPKAIASSS